MTTPTVDALVVLDSPQAARHELTVTDVLAQAEKIKEAMTRAMDDGIHFGRIPNTPKPTLFKAGAEKLCLLFRLDPEYQSTETHDGDHLSVKSLCTLFHIPTGQRYGSGEGSCSTRESKYAFRRRGGERIPNPDLADQYNTILKMSNKRALVAAVLNVTAASDVFTQDLEDIEKPEPPAKPPPAPFQDVDAPSHVFPPKAASAEPPPAPFEEWITAIQDAPTPKAFETIWAQFTAPPVWEKWTQNERVQGIAAKNAATRRLGMR